MQDKRENRMLRFVKEKGYYIVLILCVAAVGISGYFFVRTALQPGAQELLQDEVGISVPVRPEGQTDTPDPAPDLTQEVTPQPADPAETAPDSGEPASSAEDAVPVSGTAQARAVWPLSGETTRGYSMQTLSYSPTMRDWRTHDGIDIAATAGQPVRAAMDGTVSAVYDDDFLGTVVELSHEGGYTTLYANLTRMPSVTVGQAVTAGQTIGAVGDTALGESAQSAHLHFAVAQDGESVDPASILP